MPREEGMRLLIPMAGIKDPFDPFFHRQRSILVFQDMDMSYGCFNHVLDIVKGVRIDSSVVLEV